jgi:hypothetical protein
MLRCGGKFLSRRDLEVLGDGLGSDASESVAES